MTKEHHYGCDKKEISENFLFLDLISYFVICPFLMATKQLSEFEKGQIVAIMIADC